MNRNVSGVPYGTGSMPHMRGDEPDYVAQLVQQAVVCPTCVGMNRQPSADESANLRMPHMRGDEPGRQQR